MTTLPSSSASPSSSVTYYAIRQCGSLKAAAIYTSQDDCLRHIHDVLARQESRGGGGDGGGGEAGATTTVEYKTFSSPMDAFEYMNGGDPSGGVGATASGGAPAAAAAAAATLPRQPPQPQPGPATPVPKKRGRPPKKPVDTATDGPPAAKKRRGRPPKKAADATAPSVTAPTAAGQPPAKRRGRPPKRAVDTATAKATASGQGPPAKKRRGRPPSRAIADATAAAISARAGTAKGGDVPSTTWTSPRRKADADGEKDGKKKARRKKGGASDTRVNVNIADDDDEDDDDESGDDDDDDDSFESDDDDDDSIEISRKKIRAATADASGKRKLPSRSSSSNTNKKSSSSTTYPPQPWERPAPLAWDEGFQMLQEYKGQHDGSVDVKDRPAEGDDDDDDDGKWKGLYSWCQLQKVRLELFERYQREQEQQGQQQDSPDDHDKADDEGGRRLLPPSLFDATWKDRLEQLKALGLTARNDEDDGAATVAAEEGAATESAAAEGAAAEGASTEGASTEGASTEGAAPEGAAPEGAAPEGADDTNNNDRDAAAVPNGDTTSTPTTTDHPPPMSRRQKWDWRFRQLVQYSHHHHTHVVTKTHSVKWARYEGLWAWVDGQLDRLVKNRRKASNIASSMRYYDSRTRAKIRGSVETAREIDLLYEIGLGTRLPPPSDASAAVPPHQPSNRITSSDARWHLFFGLLKDYQSIFNTNDVDPIHCQPAGAKFHGLDVWVKAQRTSYRQFEKVKLEWSDRQVARSVLKRRIQLLESIQFDFKVKKSDDGFERLMAALRQYKDEHGHCNVKRDDGNKNDLRELHNFVGRMRGQLVKRQKDPSTSYLDDDRVQRLIELGGETFTNLNPRIDVALGRPKWQSKDEYWEKMFQELVAFKQKHGHTTVPHMPKSALRNWIIVQRWFFKQMTSGEAAKQKKVSPLTPDRIARLTHLGFSMNFLHRKKSFDERALEWLEYRTKHNGKDPPTETTSIGAWVLRIRRLRRQALAGKRNLLTDEQVSQLTEWGFKWETGINMPPKTEPDKTWEDRYQDLIVYRDTHGHCNVPQKYPGLGNWVHRQRKEYAWRKEGKKNGMPDEKVKKLKSLGFQWVTRKRPGKTLEETDEFKRDGIEVDSDGEHELEGGDGEAQEATIVEPPPPQRAFASAAAAAMVPTAGDRYYDEGNTHGLGPYFAPWDRYRVQF